MVSSLKLLALGAALLLPAGGSAAPITGDLSAGRGAPSAGVTISCAIEPDGTTTCAVSRGRASVCPTRIPGENIERSYRRYDYLLTEGGCTLPADYWRTHSRDGEAPFDDTWDLLGEDGEAQFFNAPETYDQILAEGAGDGPYYDLARAYIAAELNSMNGAPFPDLVARAFEEATVLFLAADPAQLEADAVPRFEALTEVLDAFSAGDAGPDTCPPLPEPFSSADIGEILQGMESRDVGTVVSVDERYGRGGGVVSIRPQSEADQFVLPDEAFTVADVRKAKFTTALADCVDVATGQQTTVEVGGLPSLPQLASAAFLARERLMRLLVAINEAAEAAELVPAAGPTPTAVPSAPAFPAGATLGGGPGAFPSATLPSVGGGGGGESFVIVPNVTGLTLSEARRILADAGLNVGNVTLTQQQAIPASLEDFFVVNQQPAAGTLVSLDDPQAVDLEVEAPAVAIPEPASLLLFATGLAFMVMVMMRRRAG